MTEPELVPPTSPVDYFSALDPPESLQTSADGPTGKLPLSDEILRQWTSGDLFGLTQSVGMGFDPRRVLGDQYLVLSTQGGAGVPHRALGSRYSRSRSRRADRNARRCTVCSLCQRSLRWSHAGHPWHV